jgi:hypothetical protein
MCCFHSLWPSNGIRQAYSRSAGALRAWQVAAEPVSHEHSALSLQHCFHAMHVASRYNQVRTCVLQGCPPFSHLCLTGGAIGSGPPMATGAAVAAPDRQVINLQADGSAMYTLQVRAVQEECDAVAQVLHMLMWAVASWCSFATSNLAAQDSHLSDCSYLALHTCRMQPGHQPAGRWQRNVHAAGATS